MPSCARDVKNIVGVKEASGDFGAIATLLNLSDGNVDVYSGNDDQVVANAGPGRKGRDFRAFQCRAEEKPMICARSFLRAIVEASRSDPVKGDAVDQGAVLRGKSDSGEGGYEPDGEEV